MMLEQPVVTAYVALGANLGDPLPTLQSVLRELGAQEGIERVECSSFYRTAPIESCGPDYVNAVAKVQTTLAPKALLHTLFTLENRHGRVRPVGVMNAPRTLDLDVLLYGDWVSEDPVLTVPHPRMHMRAFVLVPLVEIAPNCEIPGKGLARDYLAFVADQAIEKMESK